MRSHCIIGVASDNYCADEPHFPHSRATRMWPNIYMCVVYILYICMRLNRQCRRGYMERCSQFIHAVCVSINNHISVINRHTERKGTLIPCLLHVSPLPPPRKTYGTLGALVYDSTRERSSQTATYYM